MRIPRVLPGIDVTSQDGAQMEWPDGTWRYAPPLPFYSWRTRWRAAWLVLRGKADAIVWPKGVHRD